MSTSLVLKKALRLLIKNARVYAYFVNVSWISDLSVIGSYLSVSLSSIDSVSFNLLSNYLNSSSIASFLSSKYNLSLSILRSP